MSDQKDLTLKQRVFVKGYVETGNATQSAAKAYDCANSQTAAVVASENLRKPNVMRVISELMTEKGLDNDSLLAKHKELLDDEDPVVRLRALDLGYKLGGAYEHVRLTLSHNLHETIPPKPTVHLDAPFHIMTEDLIWFAKEMIRHNEVDSEVTKEDLEQFVQKQEERLKSVPRKEVIPRVTLQDYFNMAKTMITAPIGERKFKAQVAKERGSNH